jgi:heme-degrading monooxygenase HmoA
MFIAMNRFRVAKGSEADFEQVWTSRDTQTDNVPGL